MILIIDDDDRGISTLIKAIKRLINTEVVFMLPNNALTFIRDNSWFIDWVLIDEVFRPEQSKIFSTGTALGRQIIKEFDFIPLVMYTAKKYDMDTCLEILARVGFSYFLNKNEITKETTSELPDGKVVLVSARERLKRYLDEIYSLPSYISKKELRAIRKEKVVKAELLRLKGTPQVTMFREALKNYNELEKFNFTIDGKNIPLKEFLYGWIEVGPVSGELLAKTIKNANVTPDIFKFTNERWQQLFEEYRAIDNYEIEKADIDRQSMNFLIELLYIDLKIPQAPNKLQEMKTRLPLVEKTIGKQGDDRVKFKSKMIARRVFVASNDLLDEIDLEQLISLIKDGESRSEIKRLKVTKEGTKNPGRRIQPYPFPISLDLHVQKGKIASDEQLLLPEEADFFEMASACGRECRDMIYDLLGDTKSVVNLTLLINHLKHFKSSDIEEYNKKVLQLRDFCSDAISKAYLLPFIDNIINEISE